MRKSCKLPKKKKKTRREPKHFTVFVGRYKSSLVESSVCCCPVISAAVLHDEVVLCLLFITNLLQAQSRLYL